MRRPWIGPLLDIRWWKSDYWLLKHYPRRPVRSKLVFVLNFEYEERENARYRPKPIYYGDTSHETRDRMLSKWL